MNIPYGKQFIDKSDKDAVLKVLESDYLTQGPAVVEFEKNYSEYCGSKYAVAVANGTAALHLSVKALGLKKGDKVITTPITFAASANCVKYLEGDVLFADIDPKTYLIDFNKIEDLIKRHKDIKGVIPVDFAGYPVNLGELKSITEKHGIWILEDACHAPGAKYYFNGNFYNSGSCLHSDLSVFSFHPVKHIACGEGGMITMNLKSFAKKISLLRTHGITKSFDLLTKNDGGWYYEMQDLGFNYRLSDIHAALGNSQLLKANQGFKRRQEIACQYNKAFSEIKSIKLPFVDKNIVHAFHLYIICHQNRKELYNYLKENNIFCQVHYIPLHLMPYYQQFGYKKGDFPVSESYYETCLSLPMYPSIRQSELEYVIEKVKMFCNE